MTQAEQDLLYIQQEIAKLPDAEKTAIYMTAGEIRKLITDDFACMALALVGAEISAKVLL